MSPIVADLGPPGPKTPKSDGLAAGPGNDTQSVTGAQDKGWQGGLQGILTKVQGRARWDSGVQHDSGSRQSGTSEE